MPLTAILENFKNFHTRKRYFKAGFLNVLRFQELTPVYERYAIIRSLII
jgi:hypothetical protein